MKEEMRTYVPPIRFPQRLQKSNMEEQFSKFWNMFKKIEVNIPFGEALAQMSHYAKFMKDIPRKKRKFSKDGVVSLTVTYSVVIQKSL